MTMERVEVCEYKLTTLTPIHIGTGEVLSPMEYYLGPGHLVVYDATRLFELHPDLMEREIARLEGRTFNPTSLKRELREAFTNPDNQLYRAKYRPAIVRTRLSGLGHQGELRIITKTPDFSPYIPGSSIKGALRTAWAYDTYSEPQNSDLLRQLLRADDGQRDRVITQTIFRSPRQQSATHDLLRVLLVEDTTPVSSDNLLVLAERVLSASVKTDGSRRNSRDEFKSYWVFAEAVAPQTIFTGRVSFDLRLLTGAAGQILGWADHQKSLTPGRMLKAVNTLSKRVCEAEIKYFEAVQGVNCSQVLDFYQNTLYPAIKEAMGYVQPGHCYFSLGHGSGWHKLTLGILLKDNFTPERFKELRNSVGLARHRLDFAYPKTRKLVMDTEEVAALPFGWVKLELMRS